MKIFIKMVTVLALVLALHITLYTSHSYAAIPHLINYQGRLTDANGVPLNGSYDVSFRIYDAETAGSLLWQETHTGAVVDKGVFSVLLGSVTNLDLAFDKQYYLAIKVGSDAEMTPRQRITSAGYAFMSENTASIPKGVIVLWSGRIADIPSGWALCDGANGTPDLRDKFVVCARQDDSGAAKTNITGALAQSGGSTAITVANLPPHSHSVYYQSINRDMGGAGLNGVDTSGVSTPSGATGSGTPYAQPYYALAYIMKL